jgi:hypothetical protein
MVRLTDYMKSVAPGSESDPGFACYVSELRVCPDARVEIVTLAEDWLPTEILIRLEETVEAHYGVPEAIVVQRVSDAHVFPGLESAARLMPWILRHLQRTDPWLFYILSGSPAEAGQGVVVIRLPGSVFPKSPQPR